MRLAPSPGAQDSDGILRRPRRPRVDKREHEHRRRGSRSTSSEGMRMRFVGIDVAAERHVVAVVDETDRVLLKATPFSEDAEGYAKLLGLLGAPTDALVAMEATGHYWKNLFAALVAGGFAVALLNPLRTRRLPGRTCNGPRPTPSMRWGSRASPRRSAHRPAGCPIGRRRNC